ncbi:hypothetical protein IAU60_006891 [Kwoniella sp. DSM 27419]
MPKRSARALSLRSYRGDETATEVSSVRAASPAPSTVATARPEDAGRATTADPLAELSAIASLELNSSLFRGSHFMLDSGLWRPFSMKMLEEYVILRGGTIVRVSSSPLQGEQSPTSTLDERTYLVLPEAKDSICSTTVLKNELSPVRKLIQSLVSRGAIPIAAESIYRTVASNDINQLLCAAPVSWLDGKSRKRSLSVSRPDPPLKKHRKHDTVLERDQERYRALLEGIEAYRGTSKNHFYQWISEQKDSLFVKGARHFADKYRIPLSRDSLRWRELGGQRNTETNENISLGERDSRKTSVDRALSTTLSPDVSPRNAPAEGILGSAFDSGSPVSCCDDHCTPPYECSPHNDPDGTIMDANPDPAMDGGATNLAETVTSIPARMRSTTPQQAPRSDFEGLISPSGLETISDASSSCVSSVQDDLPPGGTTIESGDGSEQTDRTDDVSNQRPLIDVPSDVDARLFRRMDIPLDSTLLDHITVPALVSDRGGLDLELFRAALKGDPPGDDAEEFWDTYSTYILSGFTRLSSNKQRHDRYRSGRKSRSSVALPSYFMQSWMEGVYSTKPAGLGELLWEAIKGSPELKKDLSTCNLLLIQIATETGHVGLAIDVRGDEPVHTPRHAIFGSEENARTSRELKVWDWNISRIRQAIRSNNETVSSHNALELEHKF